MKVGEIIKIWFSFKTPEKTLKKLSSKKVDIGDGLISVALLCILIGIIFSIFYAALIYSTPLTATMGAFEGAPVIPIDLEAMKGTMVIMSTAFSIIGAPLIGIVCLIVFSGVFRLVANSLGGKGDFGRTSGFFGVIGGMYAIAAVPALLCIFIGMLIRDLAIYLVLTGLGALLTGALGGIVAGTIYQGVSNMEKTSIPRSGLLMGLSVGILIFLTMLFVAVLVAVFAPQAMGQFGGMFNITGFV